MPNPYEDLFNDNSSANKNSSSPSDSLITPQLIKTDERKQTPISEPLDDILDQIHLFDQQAEGFSKLLTKVNAIEHKVSNTITRLFLEVPEQTDIKDLKEERLYHNSLLEKFSSIIIPMRELAKLHLSTVKAFSKDITEDYYSVEKTEHVVKSEISHAVKAINIQRKILANGAEDLSVLEGALIGTEKRLKDFINVGGDDNISKAEVEMIIKKRTELTNGKNDQFDYKFFDMNLIDKAAVSLGLFMKETTNQYVNKLFHALT